MASLYEKQIMSMNKKNLIMECKKCNIKGYSKLNKRQLQDICIDCYNTIELNKNLSKKQIDTINKFM